ncbi:Zn-ribbon domain-containing OB-fold protein [Sphingopyxis panaciterrulae]|nr:OB-fold domain-containing protein [Sphingopyxis panaciterrulae]
MNDITATERPVAPYTELDENGAPYLLGSRCGACGQTHLGRFENCPKCGARNAMDVVRLASHGTLYNYTIVHRSLPGVKVPFVSATVDLDGGGTVRGNLIDIVPDPSHVKFGMPVDVIFRSASTAVADGDGFIAHFFIPAQEAAQ